MDWIGEETVESLLDRQTAFDAMEALFRTMAGGDAIAYDSVRNATGHQDALFGNKSGFDRASMTLGLKAGGYWPHNGEKGLPNHQSVTLLFDPDTGQPLAAVSGNRLTAMRTAAAAAVSIAHLARQNSTTLGVIGAGVQARFHIEAALSVRVFDTVLIWNRTTDRAEKLAYDLDKEDIEIRAASLNETVSQADVLITVVSSFEPVIPAGLVRPGTHIAAMGTDTQGKQELAADIIANAHLFTDSLQQSLTLGECQHAFKACLIAQNDIQLLSQVVAGTHSGRRSGEEITLYDGTGLGLQDLAAAQAVLKRMEV